MGVGAICFADLNHEQILIELEATGIKVPQKLDPVDLGRMLAKIALAMAAAENQLALIEVIHMYFLESWELRMIVAGG